jgi:hypothetical protein
MELKRISKRTFCVTDCGTALGIIQKLRIKRRWEYAAFEGCGIAKRHIMFNKLRDLRDFIEQAHDPDRTAEHF